MIQNRQGSTLRTITFTALTLIFLTPLIGQTVPLTVRNLNHEQRAESAQVVSKETSQKPMAAGTSSFYFCEADTVQIGTYGGSDCWGWEAPDGTEYAIMGSSEGISFVDAATATHLFTVPGPQNGCGNVRWRDMATWGQYCYAVSECSGLRAGIMVIDMSYLPDSAHYIGSAPVDDFSNVTSHNLSIDSLTGYLYVEGNSNEGRSIHILTLADPTAPLHVNSFGIAGGVHDIYARNDTVYVAEGYNPTFAIYDLQDKMNPALLARVAVPNPGYVHNIWPSDDGRHLVTTEETPGKTVKYWNIEDLNNIYLQDEYLAPSTLAHNAQMSGDTIFMSHYESGIAVVDATQPSQLAELARYDTYEGEGAGYGGAWGVFQYTTSGRIYASNSDGRLFIVQRHTGVIAAEISGDSVATLPGQHVRLDISLSAAIPISSATIPFQWFGAYNMTLDSLSTAALISDSFDTFSLLDLDSANRWGTIFFQISNSDERAAVDFETPTPIASLYFTLAPDAWGGPNFVRFDSYGIYDRQLNSIGCVSFAPTSKNGKVLLATSCCLFNRGNVNNDFEDKVNVSDLTFLTEYLFSPTAGQTPVCNEEGNVNGDPDEKVNITDVTYLVAYLFGVPIGPGPPPCP